MLTEMVLFHGLWLSLNCLIVCFLIYRLYRPSLSFWSFFIRVFAFQIEFEETDKSATGSINAAKKIFIFTTILHIVMLTVSLLFF
jgi:hypothetical protein